jgi:cytochrome c oxidase cbb3-type subunit 1
MARTATSSTAFAEVVAAMFPMYLIRAFGGLLYLGGALIMAYNIG